MPRSPWEAASSSMPPTGGGGRDIPRPGRRSSRERLHPHDPADPRAPRRHEAVRQQPRAQGGVAGGSPGNDPRHRGRERRRQVDAHERAVRNAGDPRDGRLRWKDRARGPRGAVRLALGGHGGGPRDGAPGVHADPGLLRGGEHQAQPRADPPEPAVADRRPEARVARPPAHRRRRAGGARHRRPGRGRVAADGRAPRRPHAVRRDRPRGGQEERQAPDFR